MFHTLWLVLQIENVVQIFEQLQSLISAMGPALLMPIIVFVLGLSVRLHITKTLRSALLVGVSFVGIFALLEYVLGHVGETVRALATVWGLHLVGIDVGWPAVAGFTWALGVTVFVIPLGFGVNLLLLAVGWTRTLDADIWNYWQWAFNAAIVYVLTGSWVLALGAAIITEAVVLRLADWTAELSQVYFDVPGTSFPHAQSVLQAPFAFAIERCLRRVPIIGDWEVSPDALERRLDALGDPIVLGFLVGLFISVLARQSLLAGFRTAVYVAGLLSLLPRMVDLLVEGLEPIVEQTSTRVNDSDRFGGETVVIGIDAGPIAFADTTAVVAGLVLIPYALGLAFIPGVVVMPLADLVVLPMFCMWAAAISRGNLVRTVISGAIITTIITAATTVLAPYITEMGRRSGEIQSVETGGATLVSALSAGGNWWTLGFLSPLGMNTVQGGVIVGGVLSALAAYACYRWTKAMPAAVASNYQNTVQGGTAESSPSDATEQPTTD